MKRVPILSKLFLNGEGLADLLRSVFPFKTLAVKLPHPLGKILSIIGQVY